MKKYFWWGVGALSILSVLFWLIEKIGRAWMWIKSILPENFGWWVLGIAVVLLIAGLARHYRIQDKKLSFRFVRGISGKWLKWVIVVLVAVFIHKEYGEDIHHFLTKGKSATNTTTAPLYHQGRWNLPADVVLPIIAQCESGDCSPGSARQFENDGVTPLRNREGSSALGMWQIIASTAREKCPDLNIRTLAGNEACARRLYDESGTKHWEADPRSVARWKPILLALGGQLSNGETTFVVTVGPEWSKVYRYQGSMTVDHRAIGPQKRIAMMTESGVYHFTPEKSDIVPDPVNWARFKSLTDSPENVRVTLSR